MHLLIALSFLAGTGGMAFAGEVPLPHPRPPLWAEPHSFRDAAGSGFDPAAVSSEPTACDRRVAAIAVVEPMPRLIGPDACGGSDMLRLESVLRPDGTRIELKPAPVVRCEFAESVAAWLRDEVAPRVDRRGAALRAVETFDDFECRSRNRADGAKLSEHGKGNAVDVRSLVLADGRSLGLADISVAKEFREELRDSACHRFTTVLGPGADAQHETHVHLDLIGRTGGFRMCQWDLHEPLKTEVAARVPLPLPRPAFAR
ncbi:MAG TPA: extensin family protein [Pseudolabrys sp.]|nr:extensin family protein [Pseudolabrys sp.]